MIEEDPKLRQEFHKLELEMAAFTATVKEWMYLTKSYRVQLCDKIDKVDHLLSNHITNVTDKLNALPCRERSAWYNSTSKQLKWLWGFMGTILGAIVVAWVKGK